jgi:hypothetical protein
MLSKMCLISIFRMAFLKDNEVIKMALISRRVLFPSPRSSKILHWDRSDELFTNTFKNHITQQSAVLYLLLCY